MPMTLKDLASTQGIQALSQLAGNNQGNIDIGRLKDLIKATLSTHPHLGNTSVATRDNFNNAAYNFKSDTITTGVTDPDVLAHEIGHAKNLQHAPTYQKLIAATKGLMHLNSAAAIPVMLGLRAFVRDPHTRDDVLSTLSGVSASLAAPMLVEEASATADAIMQSPDKIRTISTLLPAFGAHALHGLLPTILYQADRRLF